MKYIIAPGIVRTIRDVNLRIGEPTLKAKTKLVVKNSEIKVSGYVTDGEKINGSSLWYKTQDENYVWSGNVEYFKELSEKILHAPLAKMICTQRFGLRPEVYKIFGCPKGHNGLDFRTWMKGNSSKWKQPVFAVMEGEVSEASYDPKFKGNYVRIIHGNKYESVYLHLDSLKVKKKQKVYTGEQIGVSGNTGGASEAPHLHFGYRPVKHNPNNGYMGYLDPVSFFIDEITFI